MPVRSQHPRVALDRTLAVALPALAAVAYVAVMLAVAGPGPDRWVLAVPATALAVFIGLAAARSAGHTRRQREPSWALHGIIAGFALAAVAIPVLTATG